MIRVLTLPELRARLATHDAQAIAMASEVSLTTLYRIKRGEAHDIKLSHAIALTEYFSAEDKAALPDSKRAARKVGALRYYTGQPCLHGHLAERYTSSGQCVICAVGA